MTAAGSTTGSRGRWRRSLVVGVAFALAACATQRPPTASGTTVGRFERLDDPQGATAYAQAVAAAERGDLLGAIASLRTVLERSPDHVRSHRLYQDLARRQGGESATAMLAYYKALAARPEAADSPVPGYCLARLADTSYVQGNSLGELLRRFPDFAWGHLSLARVSRRQGRLLQAVDGFGRALVHDANLREARLERGEVLAELGRYEEAALDYDAYLAQTPADRAATRAYIDLLLYHLRRVDRALQLLQPLLAASPTDIELRMHRAAARWLAREPLEALVDYLGILADAPDHARAALNVGLLYYEVLPTDDLQKQRLWPKAAQAFAWFLSCDVAQDGHEQFERTLGVPFRLAEIRKRCGPLEFAEPRNLAALRWSAN